ncbi:MAG: tetratricopeptide repeat protein [Candidatus Omnitrophica bacterium]|nr:tetratricopeptide repeat protein [Candidatus Omnitrophota bacterium]
MANFICKIERSLAKPALAVLILVLLGVLVYANCLPNEMFWDDDDFILKNIYIQDWKYWPHFFTDNVIAGNHLNSNYWRPLLQAVFAVEWHLWSDWAPGWHLVSAAGHILAGTALYKCLGALLKDRLPAFLCAAVFIVHPVQTEATAYPNSLGDALAAIFVFWGIYAWIKTRRTGARGWWWVAWLMYPLALLSKETGILLAGYLALTEFFILQKSGTFWQKSWRTLRNLWPFIGTAIGYLALRATVLNFANSFNFYKEPTAFTSHLELRIVSFLQTLAAYTGLLFIPYDLRVERVIQPSPNLFTPDVFFGGAVFLLLTFTIIYYWKRKPLVTFGALWFLVGILPTSNLIVIINAVLYEHFLYSALVGIFLAIFWSGLAWANTKTRKRLFLGLALVFIAGLAGRSLWRTFDWRTAVGFYEKLIVTAPHSYRVVNNLGMEYAQKGRNPEAEATYRKAIVLDPTNAVAYHNLGNLCRDTGRKAEAAQFFEKAITAQSNFIFSYQALIQIYLDNQDYANARRVLEQYFQYSDDRINILNLLKNIAQKQNDPAAIQRYSEVLSKLQTVRPK